MILLISELLLNKRYNLVKELFITWFLYSDVPLKSDIGEISFCKLFSKLESKVFTFLFIKKLDKFFNNIGFSKTPPAAILISEMSEFLTLIKIAILTVDIS